MINGEKFELDEKYRTLKQNKTRINCDELRIHSLTFPYF